MSSFVVVQLYVCVFTLHIKSPVISLAGVATSIIFVMAKVLSLQTCVCHDKHVCHDKTHLLSQQKSAHHDKHVILLL